MAARRYETNKKIRFSKRPCKVLLLYKHQCNARSFHLNCFFAAKGVIYYVTIAMVILSHEKIPCFRSKAHLVFHWCLYNKVN